MGQRWITDVTRYRAYRFGDGRVVGRHGAVFAWCPSGRYVVCRDTDAFLVSYSYAY